MPVVTMIERSAVAAVVTNPRLPDNPIIACNRAFERLTGYTRAEAVGRNCAFLAGPRAERLLSQELAIALAERRPLMAEVENFRKDGTPFRNSLLIVPIYDSAGDLVYFLGSQSEVVGSDRGGLGRTEPAAGDLGSLTRRQQQVLHCLVSGLRNKQIAHSLGISERTVKMHRADLMRAMNAACAADAIRMAVEVGWRCEIPIGP